MDAASMDLAWSEEQTRLRDLLRQVLGVHLPPSRMAEIADADTPYDQDLWRRLNDELGVCGILVPSEAGGIGGSWRDAGIVAAELGRSLANVPFLSSSLVAATVLSATDRLGFGADLLAGIAAGSIVTVGMELQSDGRPPPEMSVRADQHDGQWLLDGHLSHIIDGQAAEAVLVAATTPDDPLRWFAVPRNVSGVDVAPMAVLDGTRPQSSLSLRRAHGIPLHDGNGGPEIAQLAIDAAKTGLACEQQAASEHLLDLTIQHAKTRHQFGQPIGSFQAIQHRCADLALLVDEATSARELAVWAAVHNPVQWRAAASLAAVACGEAFTALARECIHVHGGIGFTWEHVAHRYFRRSQSSAVMFGTPSQHRERLCVELTSGAASTAHVDPGTDIPRRPRDLAIFHDLEPEDERNLLDELQAIHQQGWDADASRSDQPDARGGEDTAPPPQHELISVTTKLVAPTVRRFGTEEQQQRFATEFARAELLCAQLFSEPGAGSDLAGLATRAVEQGDEWVVNGQKVWSSGAQFADLGLLLARTDEQAVKHAGITAFLVPFDTDGVTVKPLRQMSGGASFAEIFLEDVHIPNDLRLGEVGQGWTVATTMLGFEREASGATTNVGGTWPDVLKLAYSLGIEGDLLARQRLADVFIHHRLGEVASLRDGEGDAMDPGARSSLRKLQWVRQLMRIGEVAAEMLGPRLVADTGDPGTYEWSAHLLGAPGYRIAGGTDEIQRTIIAERGLGLPAGPRTDKGRPWREIPRG